MQFTLELLLAASVVVLGIFLARVLVRRNGLLAPETGRWTRYGHELATNALGFLLIGAFVAGSGLLADAACRAMRMVG